MKIKWVVVALAGFLLWFDNASGQTNDHLEYQIPEDAKSWILRGKDSALITYYRLGAKDDLTARVALEKKWDDGRRELTLFKNGKPHGVKREWYGNRKSKSELPYREGILHGTIKRWNDKGQLVGHSSFENGTGVDATFHDNGRLAEFHEFRMNLPDGCEFSFHPNGDFAVVNFRVGDDYLGLTASLNASGKLKFYGRGKKGEPSFFLCDFNADEKTIETVFHLKDRSVSKEDYLKAAAVDQELPRPDEDVERGKQAAKTEIAELKKPFSELERAKIPLEIGADGLPVSASGKPLKLPAKI